MTRQADLPQPPNPLGNDATRGAVQPIIMLAVPKSWTRLVATIVALLFLVTCVVTLMVYLTYKTAQANTDRIEELNRRLSYVEAQASPTTRP